MSRDGDGGSGNGALLACGVVAFLGLAVVGFLMFVTPTRMVATADGLQLELDLLTLAPGEVTTTAEGRRVATVEMSVGEGWKVSSFTLKKSEYVAGDERGPIQPLESPPQPLPGAFTLRYELRDEPPETGVERLVLDVSIKGKKGFLGHQSASMSRSTTLRIEGDRFVSDEDTE